MPLVWYVLVRRRARPADPLATMPHHGSLASRDSMVPMEMEVIEEEPDDNPFARLLRDKRRRHLVAVSWCAPTRRAVSGSPPPRAPTLPTDTLPPRVPLSLIRSLGVLVCAFCLAVLVSLGSAYGGRAGSGCDDAAGSRPKSIIFFISDGMGPGYLTMARDANLCGTTDGLLLDRTLVGISRTRSADSLVTDSAAGATAYATGSRTDNHVVGEVPADDASGEGARTDADYRPVGTILEGAEAAGKLTGIVTTARVTHATPAAFSSHLANRDDENEIAREQIYSLETNLLLGGGRRHFDPNHAPGSKRDDGVDLISAARARGYEVVTDRDGLFAAEMRLTDADAGLGSATGSDDPESDASSPYGRRLLGPRMLGLFASSHLPYELDATGGFDASRARAGEDSPSLEEMTRAAIRVLSRRDAGEGFFLLVEAGRVDHGGHANDAGAALGEVCAYERAFRAAVEHADANPDVLVVATSDHDTGGLSVGCCGKYAMNITRLSSLRGSAEKVTETILDMYARADEDGEDLATQGPAMVRAALAAAGRDPADAGSMVDDDAVDALAVLALAAHAAPSREHGYEGYELQNALGETLSRATLVGWTSHGHTGVDVPTFARGAGAERFRGSMANYEVGREMIRLLGVDPAAGYEAFAARMALQNTPPPPYGK